MGESAQEQRELDTQIDAFIEGFKREMYEKAIKQLQFQITQEEENLNMELGFLENGPPPRPNPAKLPPPRKPMILTKDKLQAKVFGAGYPSLPTMSVEEFA